MTETASPSPEIAVVGVGNEIMADDGIGPRMIAALESQPAVATEAIRLYDAGTTAFLALEAMSGCDRAIVVDAIETGSEPGTVQEYRYVDGAFDGEAPDMTMHDVSFTEALGYTDGTYDLPDEMLVVGIEPKRLEPGTELSEPVENAIPAATDVILDYAAAAADRSKHVVTTE
ncbi:hydrogenase maturation protease [Natronobacterium gregoryi]|uniref:Hydrogenase maturation protease n=2 Tax=Natronobacterium gregoryi TaxID=44930 RepID=L0AJV5_NATGS|nr:hydrogenase maturation protease [Natronobacterium gregoryi]AFZ73340.1 hydrogenase maturation protease [Natronobacterium gregoryi SP2]PLK18792.1 hypothetical protein CYV19_17000 [Natronobacterium gregoryi SP2]SFJ64017.1 Hydrogenase 1 maturation peptidase HyaD. Aspartic peptidase. MEROPS family A31 [Natronobacterium gregoryi]